MLITFYRAGSLAYSTVSGIKTVLSLNAIPTMLRQYFEATEEALQNATAILIKQGFANGKFDTRSISHRQLLDCLSKYLDFNKYAGSMLGSFICLYAVLCVYGSFLLYSDVQDTGCDPSAGVTDNITCENTGPDVFGAMLGIAFAAQGISQVGNFLETFAAAKAAAYTALKAINRKPGCPEEIIYHDPEGEKDETLQASSRSLSLSALSADIETPEGQTIRAILPKYEIDSTSSEGLKPDNVAGRLTFDKVNFSYPTRPGQQVLNDFSIDIDAGNTIAFVGPRYVASVLLSHYCEGFFYSYLCISFPL
jgi:ATP-binding cassette subfamily B (MDR/TAP) protein 1